MGIFSRLFGRDGTPSRFHTEKAHRENLARQLRMTPRTVEQLRGHGVRPEAELRLEFFFYTDTEEKASQLAEALRTLGYDVEHGKAATKDGTFLITGWSTPVRMDEPTVSEWTREMCELGHSHDAEFDGWGTYPLQEQSPSPAERTARSHGEGDVELPTFAYHPDPVATGSFVRSETACACCGEVRGWIYTGPVYAEEELDDCICPWCIADGSAHERLGAEFTDAAGVSGGGMWDRVPEQAVEEIVQRTPGFSGWQQEQWWTHCGAAAKFLGRAGRAELEALGEQAIAAIQDSTGLDDGPEWDESFEALRKDGSPTAYVFECSVCGALGGYQDCD